MKTVTIRLSVIVFLLMASLFSFANSEKSGNQEVKITQVENLYLGKSAEKVWTIRYSEQKNPVTITLRKIAKGKEYIVRTEFFEVVYASTKEGFGVKDMRRAWREVPEEISSSVLNKQQIQNQKALTPNSVSDDYALELIASYLPDLLNEDYRHLLY